MFKGGLRDCKTQFWKRFCGRRTFVLLGRPGVGKGQIFSSLASREGLTDFLAASWGQETREPNPAARYVGAAFYNLSFSHEVASVFDRMTYFLAEHWKKVYRPEPAAITEPRLNAIKEKLEDDINQFANDRRGKLKAVCKAYADAALLHQDPDANLLPFGARRVLIAISNVSALYDEDGEPKNTGLGRLFETLLAPEGARMPVDLVMICATGTVPRAFRAGKHAMQWQPSRMLRLLPKPHTARHLSTVEELEGALKLVECWKNVRELPDNAGPDVVVCHVLRRARTTTLATAFFPRIGLAQAAEVTRHAIGKVTARQLVNVQEDLGKDIISGTEIEERASELLRKRHLSAAWTRLGA